MGEPQQAVPHIPGMSIQFWPQTQEGQNTIASQEVFCIGGLLYQGYKGAINSVNEKSLFDNELDKVHDIDGTMHRQRTIREQRLGSRQIRKQKELDKRDDAKRVQRVADLNLIKLERELQVGSYAVDETHNSPPPVQCDICGMDSPDGHQNPGAWKNGHKMGAHKDK